LANTFCRWQATVARPRNSCAAISGFEALPASQTGNQRLLHGEGVGGLECAFASLSAGGAQLDPRRFGEGSGTEPTADISVVP
jgi:hypothetical protein